MAEIEEGPETPVAEEEDFSEFDVDSDLDSLEDSEDGEEIEGDGASTDGEGSPGDGQRPAPKSGDQPVAAPAAERPFEWKADRKAHTLEGAKVLPSGDVLIPSAHADAVRQLLSEGTVHRTSFPDTLKRIQSEADSKVAFAAELKAKSDAQVAEWKTFADHFAELAEQGPDAIAEWLDDFTRNLPELKAKAARTGSSQLEKFYRDSVAQGRPANLPAAAGEESSGADDGGYEADPVQLTTELGLVLRDLRDEVPEFRGLQDADLDALKGRLAPYLGNLFLVADRHIPERNITRGEIVVKEHLLREQLKALVEMRAAASKDVVGAHAALAANAKVGAGKNAPPPVVPVKGNSGAPAKTGRAGRPDLTGLDAEQRKKAMDEWYENVSVGALIGDDGDE